MWPKVCLCRLYPQIRAACYGVMHTLLFSFIVPRVFDLVALVSCPNDITTPCHNHISYLQCIIENKLPIQQAQKIQYFKEFWLSHGSPALMRHDECRLLKRKYLFHLNSDGILLVEIQHDLSHLPIMHL